MAQRRLRHQLARQRETVPNQIHQPTARPTLRWVFQLLEGIHRVRLTMPGQVHDLIEGRCQLNRTPLYSPSMAWHTCPMNAAPRVGSALS